MLGSDLQLLLSSHDYHPLSKRRILVCSNKFKNIKIILQQDINKLKISTNRDQFIASLQKGFFKNIFQQDSHIIIFKFLFDISNQQKVRWRSSYPKCLISFITEVVGSNECLISAMAHFLICRHDMFNKFQIPYIEDFRT